jgi:molecular chaperone DnaJ
MNYYNILGVSKDSSESEIKKAYRKKALKYHPDKNPGDEKSEEMFKKVGEAYDVLSDPQKKSNYDNYGDPKGRSNPFGGAHGQGQGQGFGGDPFDIFTDMFGAGNPFTSDNRSRRSRGRKRGSDLRVNITLTLKDVLNGVYKKIQIKREVLCKSCNGEGGSNPRECMKCKGKGKTQRRIQTVIGVQIMENVCDNCDGTGSINTNKCSRCGGMKVEIKEEVIEVDIPKGIEDGMALEMAQKGNEVKGGITGKLVIIINVEEDPNFERRGFDLLLDKDISVVKAIMGGDINIKTLESTVKFNIDKGTQNGKTLRLRGKGLPYLNGGDRRGDLIVKLNVIIPKTLSDEEYSTIESLSKSPNFEV